MQRPDDLERTRRIDRLVGPLGLLAACAHACAKMELPGREQAVAYCLVVLADKDARGGREAVPLDVEAPDAAERVTYWATAVAQTIKRDEQLHTTIQDEARAHRAKTLLDVLARFIPDHQDDVRDVVADWVGDVLAGTRPIDEMTLEAARREPPPGNAYVFRQPLTAWIGTIAKNGRPPWTRPLPPDDRPLPGASSEDDGVLWAIRREHANLLSTMTAEIAGLRTARALMAEALGLTRKWERTLDRMLPVDDADERALAPVRAALLRLTELLVLEARALTGMLAYVTLAMRSAPALQRTVVLSLRLEAIDPRAIEEIAARMRDLLDDSRHPRPDLVRRAETAPRPPLTGTRVTALTELTGVGTARRRRLLTPVARLLDALPPTVADLAAISDLTDDTLSLVGTYRSNAGMELKAIDADYARVYRRYAMGPRA